jgi:4-amino-4-deoxy-L-arabinose transferase-like glycosyltransferase
VTGERKWAILLGAAAVGARMYLAGRYALDPDECMHLSAGSAGQWFQYHHPPLTFWWVWAAGMVSEQEWWLRLGPAVAGGLAPVALLYWLRRFLSPGVAGKW